MTIFAISQIILMVGAKLQVIITRMGLRIQERGDIVKGAPLVQPGDDLFWFGKPKFMLFLINFVLFQVLIIITPQSIFFLFNGNCIIVISLSHINVHSFSILTTERVSTRVFRLEYGASRS